MGPGTGGGSRGWRRRRGDRGGVGGSSPGRSLASTKGRGEKYSSNAQGAGSEREGNPIGGGPGGGGGGGLRIRSATDPGKRIATRSSAPGRCFAEEEEAAERGRHAMAHGCVVMLVKDGTRGSGR